MLSLAPPIGGPKGCIGRARKGIRQRRPGKSRRSLEDDALACEKKMVNCLRHGTLGMSGFFRYLPVPDLRAQLGVSVTAPASTRASWRRTGSAPTKAIVPTACPVPLPVARRSPSCDGVVPTGTRPSNGRDASEGSGQGPFVPCYQETCLRGLLLPADPSGVGPGGRVGALLAPDSATAPRPRPSLRAQELTPEDPNSTGRFAGREVASGAGPPLQPPPASREVAGSAGSESSSPDPATGKGATAGEPAYIPPGQDTIEKKAHQFKAKGADCEGLPRGGWVSL